MVWWGFKDGRRALRPNPESKDVQMLERALESSKCFLSVVS